MSPVTATIEMDLTKALGSVGGHLSESERRARKALDALLNALLDHSAVKRREGQMRSELVRVLLTAVKGLGITRKRVEDVIDVLIRNGFLDAGRAEESARSPKVVFSRGDQWLFTWNLYHLNRYAMQRPELVKSMAELVETVKGAVNNWPERSLNVHIFDPHSPYNMYRGRWLVVLETTEDDGTGRRLIGFASELKPDEADLQMFRRLGAFVALAQGC